MAELSVWAPRCTAVEVVVGGHRQQMTAGEGGWFVGPALSHGTDYGFHLDGGGLVPDPRSRWQPKGVHGESRWYDQDAFTWSDDNWRCPEFGDAIIYEMHMGTVTQAGTCDSAIEILDKLVDLGVTAVEVMPVAEFSGSHGWGYDGVDLYAVHHAYGGPDAFKRFVNACHGAGLAVILDVVYNHVGPEGNYLDQFAPYFTDRYRTPWGQALNTDGPGSHEVRRFVIDNALMWLRDFHVDGLRLDAVHAIVDVGAVHLMEQLAAEVDDLATADGRRRWLIAEWDLNDPRIVRPREDYGWGLTAHWNDEFHHALHAAITGERRGYLSDYGAAEDLVRAFNDVYVYAGRYSAYRDRIHGRPPEGLGDDRFVVFAQNHDQIGNRPVGERLATLVSDAAARTAAALTLLAPQIPLIFMGEEWAASAPFLYFVDHEDPDLRRAVREGRAREIAEAFGWDPSDAPDPCAAETFERSKLRWQQREGGRHGEMLQWYRQLIALRRDHPAIQPRGTAAWLEPNGLLHLRRRGLELVVNMSTTSISDPGGGEIVMRTGGIESPDVEPCGCIVRRVAG